MARGLAGGVIFVVITSPLAPNVLAGKDGRCVELFLVKVLREQQIGGKLLVLVASKVCLQAQYLGKAERLQLQQTLCVYLPQMLKNITVPQSRKPSELHD